MFKSLIHFELIFACAVLKIFVYGVYGCISIEFHSFAYGYPVFSALLFEENGRDLHAKNYLTTYIRGTSVLIIPNQNHTVLITIAS